MELGDGEGSDKTENYIANHSTSHVSSMLVQEAPDIHILLELTKLLHPSEDTCLHNAIFKWNDIRAGECGTHQETWGVVSQRANNANGCNPGTTFVDLLVRVNHAVHRPRAAPPLERRGQGVHHECPGRRPLWHLVQDEVLRAQDYGRGDAAPQRRDRVHLYAAPAERRVRRGGPFHPRGGHAVDAAAAAARQEEPRRQAKIPKAGHQERPAAG
jgi:hypothetical protein